MVLAIPRLAGLVQAQREQLDGAQQVDEKNQPSGYAGLDEEGFFTGAVIVRYETAANMALLVPAEGEVVVTSDTLELRVGDGVTNGGVPLTSNNSPARIVVCATGTPEENCDALVAGYALAKTLTPNGSAISVTNPAYVRLCEGVYSLKDAAVSLVLDTPHVHLIGSGVGRTRIVTDRGYNINIDQDNIHIRDLTLYCFQTGSGNMGAIVFNAGAGGSYSATNTGILIENVYIENTSNNNYCTSFNASVTTFGGVYRNVWSSGPNLFPALTTAAAAMALTVTATFENCGTTATQSTALTGGAFGGTPEGVSNTAPNVFTGIIRRCIVPGTRIGILNRGLIEYSSITCTRNSQPAVHAGDGGRFYHNRLRATGTGSPYSIGYYESATISAALNLLGANGIDTGSGITNNVDTPYNVSDADWS